MRIAKNSGGHPWAIGGIAGVLGNVLWDAVKTLWRYGLEKFTETSSQQPAGTELPAPGFDLTMLSEYLSTYSLTAIGFFCFGVAASIYYREWREKKESPTKISDKAKCESDFAALHLMPRGDSADKEGFNVAGSVVSGYVDEKVLLVVADVFGELNQPAIQVMSDIDGMSWRILNYGAVGNAIVIEISNWTEMTAQFCIKVWRDEVSASHVAYRRDKGDVELWSRDTLEQELETTRRMLAEWKQKNCL